MNESTKYELEKLFPENFEKDYLSEANWEFLNDIRFDKKSVTSFCNLLTQHFEYERSLIHFEFLNGLNK